ncbi:MAG: hypothetical protein Q8M08_01745 [Bacteroidales bacterium]|nr:hypothetical protein [Bacteroidales bacterium]
MKFRLSSSLSLNIFWLVCTGLVLLRFIFPRFSTHDVTAILSWDVLSHYLWLPAFFIHDDLGMRDLGWIEHMLRHYQPLIGYWQAILPTGTADQVFASSMGAAMIYAPFFMFGHLFSIMFGFPADGFSTPYQIVIAICGLCCSGLGLWFLRKVLLSFFTEKTAAIAMVVIVFATGYFTFASFNGAAIENILFTIYLLLLFLTVKCLLQPSYGTAAGIGLIAGIIFLTRPSEAILILPWLVFLAIRLSGKHSHLTAIALAVFFITSSVQFVYWKIYAGSYCFSTATFMPGSMLTFIPYIALGTIPAGYLIQWLATKRLIWRIAFLTVFCCVTGWNLFGSIRDQVMLDHYNLSPGKIFYRYDHAKAIPASERYTARTYLKEETELLDHPEWFRTRRIFSLTPALVNLNDNRRFSPGINSPLASFSGKPWIGLKARAMVYCDGQIEGNSGNLVITLLRDRQAYQWKCTTFNGTNLKNGQWNEISLNYVIDDPQKNDTLQAYVWYTGNRQVFVSSLSVTLFEIRNDE